MGANRRDSAVAEREIAFGDSRNNSHPIPLEKSVEFRVGLP